MSQARTDIEHRVFPIEVRATPNAEKATLSGYAAVFNRDSEEMWGMTERIAPGAFKKTIREGNPKAFWNHDSNIVLGSKKAGTLRLKEDDTGLAVEIDPPDTQTVRDMVESIRRGDVDQMSFGFQVIKDEWEYDKKGDQVTRTLLEVRLFEVSPVAIPAYPDTTISARALDKVRELREQANTEPPAEHSEAKTESTEEPTAAATEDPLALENDAAAAALLLQVEIAKTKSRLGGSNA